MAAFMVPRSLFCRLWALTACLYSAGLRSQGRRIPAFYPAQAGYSGRTRTPLPQPPHGPPPSYAEAIGRRPQPQSRYLCYHRSMPGRPVSALAHQQPLVGRSK